MRQITKYCTMLSTRIFPNHCTGLLNRKITLNFTWEALKLRKRADVTRESEPRQNGSRPRKRDGGAYILVSCASFIWLPRNLSQNSWCQQCKCNSISAVGKSAHIATHGRQRGVGSSTNGLWIFLASQNRYFYNAVILSNSSATKVLMYHGNIH